MREFFQGWRRKVGCVLLMMALVFAGGWVRSRFVVDVVTVIALHRQHTLISRPRGLALAMYSPPAPEWFPRSRIEWNAQVIEKDAPAYSLAVRDEFAGRNIGWRWQWSGFDFGQIHGNTGEIERLFIFIVPHWSLALPPTLLSAYLLLWKPRKRTMPEANRD